MFLQLLAQNDETLDSMINADLKVEELNQRLVDLKTEYELMTQNATPMSFFNFENVYFWFVVCGLLILAFALGFLWLELRGAKNQQAPKSKINTVEKKNKKKISKELPVWQEPQFDEPKTTSQNRKVLQVKVRKTK